MKRKYSVFTDHVGTFCDRYCTAYEGYITFDQFPYREESSEAVNESTLWFHYLESLIDKADMDEISAVIKKKYGVEASRLMRKLLKG